MAQAPKKEDTNVSKVFSISDQDFAETGVPGVTRLINPEVAKMKAGKAGAASPAPKAAAPAPKPSLAAVPDPAPAEKTSPDVAPTGSLADLGVDLALEFKLDRGEFRFSKFKPHGKPKAENWQTEFFGKMILNLKTLGIEENFKEFSAKDQFQKDAFGIDDQTFVQVVRSQSDQALITVLLSKKSLANAQDQVRAHLEKPVDSGNDFKIELAS